MAELFIKILNLSIAGSWMILAVLLLRPLLKKGPKSLLCTLWLLVGLRLVLPFSVESVLSLIPSRQTVSAAIAEPGTLPPVRVSGGQTFHTEEGGYALPSQVELIDSGLPALDRALNSVINESFAPEIGASMDPLQVLTAVSGWLWLLGSLVILGYGAFSFLRLKLRLREAVLAGPGVREGSMVDSPFVLGIFRPVIYLPLGLSERDREMVLAHERVHLKRRDNWTKPLAFILLAVHWFNPLVWLSYVLLCRDIESACDERVLRDMGREERRAYSTALLNCSVRPRMISACPLAFGELSVKGRIKSVLNYKKPGFWISLAALAACAVVAVCFLTDPVKAPAEPTAPAAESLAHSAAIPAQPEQAGQAQPQSMASQAEPAAAPNDEFLFLIPKADQGEDYAPASLAEVENRIVDARIAGSLEQMLTDCRAAGHTVALFRTYESYADAMAEVAKGEDRDFFRSATKRELQTGLSVLLATYEDGTNYRANPLTDEQQFQAELDAWDETLLWLAEHAPDYGFIQRGIKASERAFFPGLFRYVGQDMAQYLTGQELCIEEYLMLTQPAEADQGSVALLSASVEGSCCTAYVNISPVEKEDLLMIPRDNMIVCAVFSPTEKSTGLIYGQIMRDESGGPLFYDEQTKTLRVTFAIDNYKEILGDTWPLEMTVRMTSNGRILPSPGSFLLPEPVE